MTLSGPKRFSSYYSAFAKNLDTHKVVIIIVYIDDFLFSGPDIAEMNIIKRYFSEPQKMKNRGLCCQFIGIKIERPIEENTTCLSKKIYVPKGFDHLGISDCKPVNSLIVVNIDFTKNPQEPLNKNFIWTYKSHVRTSIWVYICGQPN